MAGGVKARSSPTVPARKPVAHFDRPASVSAAPRANIREPGDQENEDRRTSLCGPRSHQGGAIVAVTRTHRVQVKRQRALSISSLRRRGRHALHCQRNRADAVAAAVSPARAPGRAWRARGHGARV